MTSNRWLSPVCPPSGNTVEVYEYSVYGQVGATDPSHTNRFMFTGREFDKETGLYYYRARYYKPEIGGFLQADPVGYDAGMNLYRYCSNNPWNHTDPFGLDSNEPNDSNDCSETKVVCIGYMTTPWKVPPGAKAYNDWMQKHYPHLPSPNPLEWLWGKIVGEVTKAVARQMINTLNAEGGGHYKAYVVMQKMKYCRHWFFWKAWKRDGDPWFEEVPGGVGWNSDFGWYDTEAHAEEAAKAEAESRGWSSDE